MRVEIRTPSVEPTDRIHHYVTERVRSALSRFAPTIERVTVTLEDLNGPRGGVDKRCTARVVEAGREPVVSEHTAETLHGAILHAIRTVGRAVARRRNRAARDGTWGRRDALRSDA